MLKFSAFIYVVKTSLYNGVLCPSSLYQCFRSSCFFGKMLSLPFSEKSYTVVVEQLITTGTEEERNETARGEIQQQEGDGALARRRQRQKAVLDRAIDLADDFGPHVTYIMQTLSL